MAYRNIHVQTYWGGLSISPMPTYFLCPIFLSCLVMSLYSCKTTTASGVFLINENNNFMWTDKLLELHSFHKPCLILLSTWGQFFLVLFWVVQDTGGVELSLHFIAIGFPLLIFTMSGLVHQPHCNPGTVLFKAKGVSYKMLV